MDSTNKQLVDWVEQSLKVNPEYKLAIKGDVTTEYPKVKSLFEGLRDIDFLKFWLITSQEAEYPRRYDSDGGLRVSFDYLLYVHNHILKTECNGFGSSGKTER
jgi:hypothetical protein